MVEDTSRLTYKQILKEGVVEGMQSKVLQYIAKNPNLTDTEIAKGMGFDDPNNTRPRRKELVDLTLVESNGKKLCSFTDRMCYQWRMVEYFPTREDIEQKKTCVRFKCPLCQGKGTIPQPQASLPAFLEVAEMKNKPQA